MEYSFSGIITLSPTSSLKLDSSVNYIAPSKVSVILSSENDDRLSVQLKLEADSDSIAEKNAKLEINRVCDLLCFSHNIGILRNDVTGWSHPKNDGSGMSVVGRNLTALWNVRSKHSVTLDNSALTILSSSLEQSRSAECEEAIGMWRESFCRESSVERFDSLYRLMEHLFGSAGSFDSWIQEKDNSVQMFPKNNYRGKHTIYTYLRDNIHHFKKDIKIFLIKEIQENLPKFQNLAQQAIKEKFNI
jgi:hypothetical protein